MFVMLSLRGICARPNEPCYPEQMLRKLSMTDGFIRAALVYKND